jgi:hypothetical protein
VTTEKDYSTYSAETGSVSAESLSRFVAVGRDICAAIEIYGGAGRAANEPYAIAFSLRLLIRQAIKAAELLEAIGPEEARWLAR